MVGAGRERDGTRTALVPGVRRVSGVHGTADAQHPDTVHGASARSYGHLGAELEGGDVRGAARHYGVSHGVFRQRRDGYTTAATNVESSANGFAGHGQGSGSHLCAAIRPSWAGGRRLDSARTTHQLVAYVTGAAGQSSFAGAIGVAAARAAVRGGGAIERERRVE